MLIYLSAKTTRTEYTFNLIFSQLLGLSYATTTDEAVFRDHKGVKLSYRDEPVADEYFVKSSGLLFRDKIIDIPVEVMKKNLQPVIFPNDGDLGFDIFSAVFYMVGRYEEYLPHPTDDHGRFKASDSFAFKNDFLHQPVVNIWIDMFQADLKRKYPDIEFREKAFSSVVSYDIDIAYQFKGRGVLRSIGGLVKDIMIGNFSNVTARIKTLSALQNDPWDIYNDLKNYLQQRKIKPTIFFLLADHGDKDKNIPHRHPLMQKLIKTIQSFAEIGIHPSFTSGKDQQKIINEKQRLEDIAGTQIIRSRQHYLRFFLPETYQYLLRAGIKEDYSMGFADMPGFRAGICTPFYFYDLQQEVATDLKVFPITIMESSLIHYMKVKPADALNTIKQLMQQVKKVSGTFISIWHNHTISKTKEYIEWKAVHDQMITELIKITE
ncbi:hypothetical protein BH09BAC2_BH09BAC2_10780 [soil metagenome]